MEFNRNWDWDALWRWGMISVLPRVAAAIESIARLVFIKGYPIASKLVSSHVIAP